jgi:hypothetical protein
MLAVRLAIATVFAVSLGACSSDTASGTSSTTTRRASSTIRLGSSTSTTAEAADGEILSAYQAYWRMVIRVNDPPKPADPEIPLRTTGEQLVILIKQVQENEQNNLIIRRPSGSVYEHRER